MCGGTDLIVYSTCQMLSPDRRQERARRARWSCRLIRVFTSGPSTSGCWMQIQQHPPCLLRRKLSHSLESTSSRGRLKTESP